MSVVVRELFFQARTSYLPNEILWGHHFDNPATVTYDRKAGVHCVHHNMINKTVVDLTPRCSAKQLKSRRGGPSSSSSSTTGTASRS